MKSVFVILSLLFSVQNASAQSAQTYQSALSAAGVLVMAPEPVVSKGTALCLVIVATGAYYCANKDEINNAVQSLYYAGTAAIGSFQTWLLSKTDPGEKTGPDDVGTGDFGGTQTTGGEFSGTGNVEGLDYSGGSDFGGNNTGNSAP